MKILLSMLYKNFAVERVGASSSVTERFGFTMSRVAKPGAPVVVADEMPDFLDFGHRLGFPGLDRWIASKLMSMGDDFAGLIERHRNIDIAEIGRRVLNDSRYEVIWRGGGYLMLGNAPVKSRSVPYSTPHAGVALETMVKVPHSGQASPT